jgi:hypothetical protein
LAEIASRIDPRMRKSAEIRGERHLARSLQFSRHRCRTIRRHEWRQTMTFNLASLQNVTLSLVGALVAATLCISAAVGPAAHLI